MAQDFSLRYPLIDGHGNFGSPDPNDRPAAPRYTEARLAPLAMELLGEIDEDTVDFAETYDGQHQRAARAARRGSRTCSSTAAAASRSAWPRTSRRTTSREVIDATLHLIDNPDATVEDLMQFVHGPDFPTGATDPRPRPASRECYRTGRGSIRCARSPRSTKTRRAASASSSPRCRTRRRSR